MRKARFAGDGSTTPAFTARTQKRYLPGFRLKLFGDLQALNFGCGAFLPFLSFLTLVREHSKLAPAVVELKRNLTLARLPLVLTLPFGPLAIFVCGAGTGRLVTGGSRPETRATPSFPAFESVTQTVLPGPAAIW